MVIAMAAQGNDIQGQLSRMLDEVRAAVVSPSLRLGAVLQMVLDTIFRVMEFQRVVLCLRETGRPRLVGRVGLGPAGSEISAAFRIQPDSTAVSDRFGWLCARGADLLVSDAKTVSARLPAWYRERVNAPTFLLLPLMLKGQPIGLIYADKATAGAIRLAQGELALLRALRDQAPAAFQKGQA